MFGRAVSACAARPLPSILIGWALSRALLLGQVLAFGDAYLGDVRLYALWSTLLASGHYPAGDPFWQYPPGAGMLFAVLAFLGPRPVASFIGLALLADAATLGMLIRRAMTAPGDAAGSLRWLGPAAWVVGGLAIGPVLLTRFDVFPTALAVAALLMAARPWASGALAGIGALLKAWPILMVATVRRRSLPRAAIAAVGVIAAGALGLSLWAPGSGSFIGGQGSRGLQVESVAALPYAVLGAFGAKPDIVLRFGAFEIDDPGAPSVGLALTLLGLLAIGWIVILRLTGRLESIAPGDVGLALILISVATSRVNSPQYSVWLVGIAAAAAGDQGSRLRRVVALVIAMAAVTQALFPWAYGSYLDTEGYAVALQAARIGLLLAATASATMLLIAPASVGRIPLVRALVRP